MRLSCGETTSKEACNSTTLSKTQSLYYWYLPKSSSFRDFKKFPFNQTGKLIACRNTTKTNSCVLKIYWKSSNVSTSPFFVFNISSYTFVRLRTKWLWVRVQLQLYFCTLFAYIDRVHKLFIFYFKGIKFSGYLISQLEKITFCRYLILPFGDIKPFTGI